MRLVKSMTMGNFQRRSSRLCSLTCGVLASLILGSATAQNNFPEAPPLADEDFPPKDEHYIVSRFVHHREFPAEVRERMNAFNQEFARPQSLRAVGQALCPKTQRYIQNISDRLISASHLRARMNRNDYPMTVVVTCSIVEFPDAQMKAGILEVSAELVQLLRSEDEIAAVLAHEMAHFTLAHEHAVLESWHRLPPFAINRLRMWHEQEADAESLVLLANAGYDTSAAVDALRAFRDYMKVNELQSSSRHPQVAFRIEVLSQRISRISFPKASRRLQGLEVVKHEIELRPQSAVGAREDD